MLYWMDLTEVLITSNGVSSKNILFYSDAKTMGGHELMALEAINALSKQSDYKVSVIYNQVNLQLAGLLSKLERVNEISIEGIAIHFGILKSFKFSIFSSLAQRFLSHKPDLIVSIQGNTDISSAGLFAAKKAGIPSVSYIPLPHHLNEIGGNPGIYRRWLNDFVLSQPDAWITIHPSLETVLRNRKVTQPIFVVNNGLDLSRFPPMSQNDARNLLQLPTNKRVVSFVGRFVFRHKGLGFFFDALKRVPKDHPMREAHLLFVGEGQERKALEKRLSSSAWAKAHTIKPWTDEVNPVYRATDLIVIPSEFEGVPLVMLEAMYCELPIVASRVGAIPDFLSQARTFDFGNETELLEKLGNALKESHPNSEITENKKRVEKEHSLEIFGKQFHEAVEACLKL